jgi:photosystem II stability/assembly factor-like uncharacterized protein
MDPANPSDVYAGTEAGLFHSHDGGNSWPLVNSDNDLTSVAIQPGSLDVFSLLGQSSDGGSTWQTVPYPSNSGVPVIAADAPSVFFAGNSFCYGPYPGQVYKTTDSGATWTLSFGFGFSACSSVLVSPQGSDVFAREDGFAFKGVFQSHDGGTSWTGLDTSGWYDSASFADVLAVDPTDRNVVYAANAGKLWISLVGAGQWMDVGAGLPIPVSVTSVAIDPTSPATLYAATDQGVFRRADRGATWARYSDGLPDGPASALVIDATGRYLHVAAAGGVYDLVTVPPCADSAVSLCFLGGRFVATVIAVDPRTGRQETGHAVAQDDRWGYFSLPDFTGDPDFPEIVVKMADASSLDAGYWLFHSGLTDLQYTLMVQDTVTGFSKSYQNDRSDPESLCGGADTSSFTGFPAATRSAAKSSAPGSSLTLLGRFHVALTAVDPRTGTEAMGVAISRDAKWGYFSLPAFTGDPAFPEAFVKMLDATSLPGGYFWLFHTGLTDLEYTLTVTDSTTGGQKVYRNDRSDPSRLCGAADTQAFHD